MEELAVKVLGPLGLSGLVILALATTVWYLFRQLAKAHTERLADVPLLVKALENNTQATRENALAIQARNAITEEQGRIIDRQASAFELYMQKTDMQSEQVRDRLTEVKYVVDALAQATRTNSAITSEVRDHLDRSDR